MSQCTALSYTHSRPTVPIYFFFNTTPAPDIYTLSLHDALPISRQNPAAAHDQHRRCDVRLNASLQADIRSEEHTSELQSRFDLVCRLLLEKKKNKTWALRCYSCMKSTT